MSWTLHHGDCLDPVTGLASLADRSVDHVITDPPYEAEAHNPGRRILHGTPEPEPLDFAAITETVRAEVARQMVRVCRRWIAVFCQVEAVSLWRSVLTDAGARYARAGIWVKPNGVQLTGDRPAQGYESIVLCYAPVAGKMRWNGGGRRGVWEFSVETNNRVHSTQKPLDLMSALVRDFTDHGETVLDPFAGSGTTGVACIQLGRSFLGWERAENYHAVAHRRLSAAREQPSLFAPKAPKPKTGELFGGAVSAVSTGAQGDGRG